MPAPLIAAAGVNGFVFGFFRIAWIIIASIYLYNVAVETGQFQVMKESIAGVSSDRRLQVILIAFCFGAFLEGTGGGGAPVAIAGSFLIGLGFPHFQAADPVPPGQHRARGVGGRGQPHSGAERGHRASHPGAERHGRPDPAALLPHPPGLARRHHGRVEKGARGAARARS